MLKCTNKGHLIIRLHVMPYLNAFPHSSLISFFFLIIAQYWTTILSAWVFSFAVLCLVAQLYPTLCNPIDCSPPSFSAHGDSPGKNTWVGCHALLRGSSQHMDWIQVSHIASRVLTIWATREARLNSLTHLFFMISCLHFSKLCISLTAYFS